MLVSNLACLIIVYATAENNRNYIWILLNGTINHIGKQSMILRRLKYYLYAYIDSDCCSLEGSQPEYAYPK